MRIPLLLLALLVQSFAMAGIDARLGDFYWPSRWIACPGDVGDAFGVFHFRKSFSLDPVPDSLVIHVSADQRYKLWVNGEEIGKGPSRGDLANWPFESYDIAPYLKSGDNLVAAQVWNAGSDRPVAQHSLRTAFLLQPDLPQFDSLLVTGPDWKVFRNSAYAPVSPDRSQIRSYIVVGPGDRIDGSAFPWGWNLPEYSDDEWENAVEVAMPVPPSIGTAGQWQLIPRTIPAMEEFMETAGKVRRVTGISLPEGGIDLARMPLTIPPNTEASILLDRGILTMGYPVLTTSGGSGSSIHLTYAEALFDENRSKGNRDEIEGKEIVGLRDQFLPGGSNAETYTTLWIRTYRYLQLDIQTGDEPLAIDDLRFRFSAYPFTEVATFSSDDPDLSEIWKTGWRTARLCAGETYFDCPYYEQLQYVGDTRIQALISLYVTGDDRLMRKAIRVFEQSRYYEGLTRSRYPSYHPQVIPTFSLFWINMVYDYLMHRPDRDFVRAQRMGIITVLDWYQKQLGSNGLVGETPHWNFVDWTREWKWSERSRHGGVPELAGGSSILSLQMVYALEDAARIFDSLGEPYYRDHYRGLADQIRESVRKHCWDAQRGLFADTPAFTAYSQHANILAILTGTVAGEEANKLMEKILSEDSLIQATFYFKFYLFQALNQTGLADRYIEQLQPWKDMLAIGLSTFAEKPDPTRSDCHAWSASPNYDFLATVCGIRPASPGFATVSITPYLGELRSVSASMPHPNGIIKVDYQREGTRLKANVTLPAGINGSFTWNNRSVPLHDGLNELDLR